MSLPETIQFCPTCNGLGFLPPSWTVEAQAHVAPDCPDCIDGYPKVAVERAAKAICGELLHGEFRDAGLESMHRDREFCSFSRELALAAIRAFHNEGSE